MNDVSGDTNYGEDTAYVRAMVADAKHQSPLSLSLRVFGV